MMTRQARGGKDDYAFASPLFAHAVFAWYLFFWAGLIQRWDLGAINDYFALAALNSTILLALFVLNHKSRAFIGAALLVVFLAELAILAVLFTPDYYGYTLAIGAPLLALGVYGLVSVIFGRLFSGPDETKRSAETCDFTIFVVLAAHAIACGLYSIVFIRLFLDGGGSLSASNGELHAYWVLPLGFLVCGVGSMLYFSSPFLLSIGRLIFSAIVIVETVWAFSVGSSSTTSGLFSFFFVALWACSVSALVFASHRVSRQFFPAPTAQA